jgi:hypothetical protein
LTVLDEDTFRTRAIVPLAREPRGVAVDPDHGRIYVSHLVAGVLSVVSAPSYAVHLLQLPLGPQPVSSTEPLESERPIERIRALGSARSPFAHAVLRPRDTAALARALTLSPDGSKLYVAYTVETTNPESFGLSFDTYYGGVGADGVARPATTVAVLDLASERWTDPGTLTDSDFLGPPPPLQDPTWLGFRAHDGALLVTARGRNTLAELASGASDPARVGRAISLALNGCAGPDGAATLRDGTTLVNCAFSHRLQVIQSAEEDPTTVVVLGEERDDAEVAWGRVLYHRADAYGISRFGFACASCHPDGRDDGVVWSTVRGPMQTPWLAGRVQGTAPYGWDGIHEDLEANVRATVNRIGGDGSLDERAVHALAAYMLRGMHAPRRASPPGGAASAGAEVFAAAGCASCHDPARAFTDGLLHDVGSGQLSARTPGFDTPSLRYVGLTPPYFHDGRYATLDDWLSSNDDHMGQTRGLDARQRALLLSYLRSL